VHDDGEDERSIQQHITTMKQQMGKTNRDVSVVSDRMLRTNSHRRELIQSGATLADVLQTYPALKDQAQVPASLSLLPSFVSTYYVGYASCPVNGITGNILCL